MSDLGPGTLQVPDGCHAIEGRNADQDVAVVASRYNAEVVQRLLDGAVARLIERERRLRAEPFEQVLALSLIHI